MDDNKIMFMLGEIISRLDAIQSLTAAKHTEYDLKISNHDERLKKLENGRSWLMGAAAAVGAIASAFYGAIFK